MPRHIKIGLIILTIGFAVTLAFFVDVVGRIQSIVDDGESTANPFIPPAEPLYAPTDPPINVKLFFPSATGDSLLASEDQAIFRSTEPVNRAKQILQKLQEGPISGSALPALPPETTIEELFVASQGLAFVDFANTISTNHPGGILNEMATIYSIVNSLAYNLPEIQQVKILVGGIEKETLAGHCLLLLPFEMDLSLTDVFPNEEPATPLAGHATAQP